MEHSDGQTLLEVSKLNTSFRQNHVVKDFDLSIKKGETIAIVGESGSGKTVALSSLLGLFEAGHADISIEKCVFIDHKPLIDKRGKDVAMVFQNASLSLNPVVKCGQQVARVIRKHLKLDKSTSKSKVIHLFESLEITEANRIYHSYPHEVSGGELQRVMIAMGLSCSPQLLILDEPAASLDKISQYNIMNLLRQVKEEHKLAIILISHDIEMVSEIADQIIHIQDGEIVATQSTEDFFIKPASEHSEKLIAQLRQFREADFIAEDFGPCILELRELKKTFGGSRIAFENISFTLHTRERLGVIGESGSGKSSIGKCIAGVWEASSGEIVCSSSRDKVTYVFQDAYSAMDPELTVEEIVQEVLRLGKSRRTASDLLKEVLLDVSILSKKTNELSGGQRQRVNLARALATDPEILICDEITSGLDLIVQFEIIELLHKQFKDVAIVFISHDISLVKYFCHRVIVLKDGQIEKQGRTHEIFEDSSKGYTQNLINSVPKVKYFLNM